MGLNYKAEPKELTAGLRSALAEGLQAVVDVLHREPTDAEEVLLALCGSQSLASLGIAQILRPHSVEVYHLAEQTCPVHCHCDTCLNGKKA